MGRQIEIGPVEARLVPVGAGDADLWIVRHQLRRHAGSRPATPPSGWPGSADSRSGRSCYRGTACGRAASPGSYESPQPSQHTNDVTPRTSPPTSGVAGAREVEQHLQFAAAVAGGAARLLGTDHLAAGRLQRGSPDRQVLIAERCGSHLPKIPASSRHGRGSSGCHSGDNLGLDLAHLESEGRPIGRSIAGSVICRPKA